MKYSFATCRELLPVGIVDRYSQMAATISEGSAIDTVVPAIASRTTSATPPMSIAIAGKPREKPYNTDIDDLHDVIKASAADKNGAE